MKMWPRRGWENHPVALVSKAEGKAHCDWLSGELGKRFALPTEDIYKKAMKGANGVKPGYKALEKTERNESLEGTRGIMWFPPIAVRE